ncbi:retrovirus-related pol polyprotein from transposon TNT 1-94 [Tanacetum coccineum]
MSKSLLSNVNKAVEQTLLESRTFEVKMNQVLSENERLLAQAIDNDIVKTVMNLSVNEGGETVNECQKVRLSTSASGSQPSGNSKNDRILQTPSSNSKNKVEAHPRNVKSSLNKKNGTVNVNGSAVVQNLKKQDNSDYVCIHRDDCMSSDNLCVSNSLNVVKSRAKPKKNKSKKDIWKPTGNVVPILSSGIWIPLLDTAQARECEDRSQLHPISSVNSWVYYVEGLGHNLFSVGQFCDSNLEVAFRQHTCFIRNLEGVDLLTGSRGDNLYTLSLGNMMASSPICLLSKASKTKSWLWHRRLSHLNFGSINHLARHGLVRGLPKLKFEKDHLCSACALGKSSKKPHKPKSEDTNQEKLYLLHMDLCGPMRVASVNGKKYILVDLQLSKYELRKPSDAIKQLMELSFVNQTLREYYEKVGISHETSSCTSLTQQNGVVERETQNRSMIRRRHGKTPYELLHDKPPVLSYLHVFGALCYPANDSENLGKLQPKADIVHVDFDELTAMASEHSSSGPALHEMTPVSISSGLVPNPPSSTPFVPPSRSDWDLLFQPMFDESLNPSTNVDLQAQEVIAPIPEAVAPEHAVSTGSPTSTTVDQDASSPSNSHTTQETQTPIISHDVEEDKS